MIFVDGSWFCFFRYGATSVWYSKHKKIGGIEDCNVNNEQFMSYYKDQFNSCIEKIAKKFKITNIADIYWFADTKQSDLWRIPHHGDYKATRKCPTEIGPVIKWTYKNLIPSHKIISFPKTEADDGIAVAIRWERSQNPLKKLYIISGDSDLLQLCDDNCKVICPKGNPSLKPTIIEIKLSKTEKIVVSPQIYLDVKLILGDKTDEIKPVGGIGPKTAIDCANDKLLFEKNIKQIPERWLVYQKNNMLINLSQIPTELQNGLLNSYMNAKSIVGGVSGVDGIVGGIVGGVDGIVGGVDGIVGGVDGIVGGVDGIVDSIVDGVDSIDSSISKKIILKLKK